MLVLRGCRVSLATSQVLCQAFPLPTHLYEEAVTQQVVTLILLSFFTVFVNISLHVITMHL